MSYNTKHLAPPCGLFCGCCSDQVIDKKCHGCGCECGKCAGSAHSSQCDIVRCVKDHDLEHCGECQDFPCTMLIQFANDPIWRTHLPVLENLRRRKKIGTEKWIEEQKQFWSKQKRLEREIKCHQECSKKWQEWMK